MKTLLLVVGLSLCLLSNFQEPKPGSQDEPAKPSEKVEKTDDPKPENQIVFLNGTEASFRDKDDKELWRIKTSDGEFFRDTLGESLSAADEDHLYLTTDSSILAIDLKTGEEKWAYDFVKPSEFARSSPLIISDDKVIVHVNQHSAPLVCLDKTTGDMAWRYPAEDSTLKMGFRSITLNGDQILFQASVSNKAPQQGYYSLDHAVDLNSGKLVERAEPKEPAASKQKDVTAVFAGESNAPVQKDDLFTGVLKYSKITTRRIGKRKWTKSIYNFERPKFYTNRPWYQFKGGDQEKLKELVGAKVEIRGNVVEFKESYPPIIVVEVLEVKSLEE